MRMDQKGNREKNEERREKVCFCTSSVVCVTKVTILYGYTKVSFVI